MARGRMSGNALEAVLMELGENIANEAKQALLNGGNTILSDAKSRIQHITPNREATNNLADSGKVKANKKGNVVTISFDAENKGYKYGKIVEFRPGHEHPFLYPACDAHRAQVKENVIGSVRRAVQASAVT